MTKTKQPHSLAHIQDEETDISLNCYMAVKEAKANVKESLQHMLSICNSMNNLCINLNSLDNLMESLIFCEEKEKSK